jgi:hypothetical protein
VRLKEIKLNKDTAPMPDGTYDHLPRSLSVVGADAYYDFYRLLISMAGLPDSDLPVKSVIADFPFACAYTPEEQEMIERTLKRHGHTPRYHSSEGSREAPTVNKVSPLPQNSGKTIRRT